MSTLQSDIDDSAQTSKTIVSTDIKGDEKDTEAVLKFESEEDSSNKRDKDKPDMDFSCMMMEAKKEFEKKNPNKAHLKMMLRRTYEQRRKEIKVQDAEAMPMMSSILLDWPLLEEGQYVSVFF